MSIDGFDSRDIYLRLGNQIIGLHSVGHAVPYEYNLIGLDGSVTTKTSDFMTLESWGNEYDENFNMLGRGSFRVFQPIEELAKELESDGWVRFERTNEILPSK